MGGHCDCCEIAARVSFLLLFAATVCADKNHGRVRCAPRLFEACQITPLLRKESLPSGLSTLLESRMDSVVAIKGAVPWARSFGGLALPAAGCATRAPTLPGALHTDRVKLGRYLYLSRVYPHSKNVPTQS